jgi:hypothetical protein
MGQTVALCGSRARGLGECLIKPPASVGKSLLRRAAPSLARQPGAIPAAANAGRVVVNGGWHQVIEWASTLVKPALLAPLMFAITTPIPPDVGAIDNVPPLAESVTFR